MLLRGFQNAGNFLFHNLVLFVQELNKLCVVSIGVSLSLLNKKQNTLGFCFTEIFCISFFGICNLSSTLGIREVKPQNITRKIIERFKSNGFQISAICLFFPCRHFRAIKWIYLFISGLLLHFSNRLIIHYRIKALVKSEFLLLLFMLFRFSRVSSPILDNMKKAISFAFTLLIMHFK